MHMNHTIRVEPPASHGDKVSPQNTRQTSSSTISTAIAFIIHILSELESTDVNLYFSLRLDFAGGHIRVKRSSDAVTPAMIVMVIIMIVL